MDLWGRFAVPLPFYLDPSTVTNLPLLGGPKLEGFGRIVSGGGSRVVSRALPMHGLPIPANVPNQVVLP